MRFIITAKGYVRASERKDIDIARANYFVMESDSITPMALAVVKKA
jgi:hypothetical protein